MKKIIAAAAVCLCFFSACKKNTEGSSNLSADITNFVPAAVIDSMRAWGLAVNEGKTPPVITGIYNISPNICTYDNSGANAVNATFSDYHFRFHDQDNNKLTISVDYKALSVRDTATGTGSFISGAGDNFTIFVDQKGAAGNVTYEAILFYSGTKTAAGIQHFQLAIYLKSKSADQQSTLSKVGISRIFKYWDCMSALSAVYRTLDVQRAMVGQ